MKTTHKFGFIAGFAVALGLLFAIGATDRGDRSDPAVAPVVRGALSVWSTHTGRFEANDEVRIVSVLGGTAALLELLPEGTTVSAGDIIARFDGTALELELLRLEEEFAAAEADHDAIVAAKHPLEIRTLEAELFTAEQELRNERAFLEESRALAGDGLISDVEAEEQAARVQELELRYATARDRLALTRSHLHPAELKRARARLSAATRALEIAERKFEAATVRAPVAGVVIYPPIPIGSEFRSVRVGDSVLANQVFATLPDFSALVVDCEIPESELATIGPGTRATVRPLAHPQMRLQGTVVAIGASGHTVPGQPAWQRYFRARVALTTQDPRIRPGMTAIVDLLTYDSPDALLVPRRAVQWNEGEAFVTVAAAPFDERRRIVVGYGDAGSLEVIDGLDPGERVRLQ